MQHQIHARSTKWVQLDAGVWTKPALAGHVEISFATDPDGTSVFDVTAYDDHGRRCERLTPAEVFHDFARACDIGDRLSSLRIAPQDGCRLN